MTDKEKQAWLDKNSGQATLLAKSIIGYSPEIGYFLTIEGIQISQEIFPEEFEKISREYFSVIEHMKKHYKHQIQIK